jgi:hypothetical protein
MKVAPRKGLIHLYLTNHPRDVLLRNLFEERKETHSLCQKLEGWVKFSFKQCGVPHSPYILDK